MVRWWVWCVVFVVALGAGVAWGQDSVAESPMFLGGPEHHAVGSTDASLDATAGLQRLWARQMPRSVVASPAVANGRIYVATASEVALCCDPWGDPERWRTTWTDRAADPKTKPKVSAELVCVDAATGKTLWSTPITFGAQSSPAVADGRVIVGGFNGSVLCFNAETGDPQWTAPTGSIVTSSPAVVDGVCYIGSWDGKLYALDAATGAEVWTAQTGGRVASSPTVSGGHVYVGSGDGSLYAFDAATGAQAWTMWTAGPVDSSPVVWNDTVLVGSCDGSLYRADAATGTVRWSAALGAPITASPLVAGADRPTVYIGTWAGRFCWVDADTGEIVPDGWQPDDAGEPYYSSASALGSSVVVGGPDVALRGVRLSTVPEPAPEHLSPSNGPATTWPLWAVGGPAGSSPVVLGDTVCVVTDRGLLSALTCDTAKAVTDESVDRWWFAALWSRFGEATSDLTKVNAQSLDEFLTHVRPTGDELAEAWRHGGYIPAALGSAAGPRDVPPLAGYRQAVVAGMDTGVLKGEPNGTYRPLEPMLRSEAAMVLARLLWRVSERLGKAEGAMEPWVPTPEAQAVLDEMIARVPAGPKPEGADLADIAWDHWCYDAVMEMLDAELMTIGEDGRFRPDEPLTYDELAAAFARLWLQLSGFSQPR